MSGPPPGGEFITNRSSPTSTDPAAAERFVAVEVAAERAWHQWVNSWGPWPWPLTGREWAKLAYLAGWYTRDRVGR